MQTLEDLFFDSLADVYYAENQLLKALPAWVKAATDADLRGVLQEHLLQTDVHAGMVTSVFATFGEEPNGRRSPAILGLLKEGRKFAVKNQHSPTINAALIFAWQKAVHYQIASYGTLRDWARLLGNGEAAGLLDDILEEEKAADARLTSLAREHCNVSAKYGRSTESARRFPPAPVEV